MKNNLIYKIIASLLVVIFVILALVLNSRAVRVSTFDKYFDENETQIKNQFIVKFLESLDFGTIQTIGISKNEIVNKDLSKIDVNIISDNDNNCYILLHNKNNNNNKDYITVFKRGLFFYKKIGNPIKLNNIIDIFMLPIKTDEKYIIFTRDLIGFETKPLDLLVNLNAFVYDKQKKDFVQALDIIENVEEYNIIYNDQKSMYKKFRTKSDIMVTNGEMPSIEILTHYYEAISQTFDKKLSNVVPYDLNFDIIKTSSKYSTYFYDEKFKHFILGYLKINETGEIVGITKINSKTVNNNFIDTYTIIKEDGEIFEIFDDFELIKLN